MNFPLGAVTATVREKVKQAACVHGDNHFCCTRIRQNKTGVLNRLFLGVSGGGFFVHSRRYHVGLMARRKHFGKAVVFLLRLFHGLDINFLCLLVLFDFGRQNVFKLILFYIALALNAERGYAVTGNLGKQGA